MGTVRKTGRVRENTWKCSCCGRVNRGRDRECIGCGRPRGADVEYMHDGGTILEGEEAEKYLKGPDWFCECCDSYNPAYLERCRSCDAPRGASKDYFQIRREKEEAARQEAENRMPEAIPVREEPVTEPSPALERKHGTIPVKNKLKALFAGLGMAAFIAGIVWFMAWLMVPDEKSGTVTDLTWRTSVTLEELKTHRDEGWDPPLDARILDTEWKFRDTDRVVDHTETVKVPVTKYRDVQDPDKVWTTWEDLGNGFDEEVEHREEQWHKEPYTDYEEQEVKVYKDVDVYDYWYTYEYDRWEDIRTESTEGSKGTEHGPDLHASGDRQRTTDPVRTFRVSIETEEGADDYSITDGTYGMLNVGDTVTFEVNRLGTIRIMEINGTPVGDGKGN